MLFYMPEGMQYTPMFLIWKHQVKYLKTIKLPANRKWINDIDTPNIQEILLHSTIETIHLPRQLVFIIHIAVVESNDYLIYHLFPLPHFLKNHSYSFIIPYLDYLLEDETTSYYTYIKTLKNCEKISNTRFLHNLSLI